MLDSQCGPSCEIGSLMADSNIPVDAGQSLRPVVSAKHAGRSEPNNQSGGVAKKRRWGFNPCQENAGLNFTVEHPFALRSSLPFRLIHDSFGSDWSAVKFSIRAVWCRLQRIALSVYLGSNSLPTLRRLFYLFTFCISNFDLDDLQEVHIHRRKCDDYGPCFHMMGKLHSKHADCIFVNADLNKALEDNIWKKKTGFNLANYNMDETLSSLVSSHVTVTGCASSKLRVYGDGAVLLHCVDPSFTARNHGRQESNTPFLFYFLRHTCTVSVTGFRRRNHVFKSKSVMQ
ncbi:hypothetical protein RRG08_014723 [Elysia crispata]|uniref:Uncharacterized protein n=1 Tax=Elysia crispata TaxID=231223 RepID=A0AAE1E4I5_9GAST|nr:hypothetical protein RRG08_014723 [Elysia crispata]